MYELLNNCTSDIVYHNDNIKITMSLTGKILPLEFKHRLRDDISTELSKEITDDFFNHGVATLGEIRLNKIELVMTINADGTFTDEFELIYHDNPHRTSHHRFKDYDFPLPYISIYRKKALRILKRICQKGLNQPSNFRMSKYD